MIRSLYNFTAKGLLQALSFILATFLFGFILLNSSVFAQHFGGKVPYLALLAFYGMAILWIHGIGFTIRSAVWQLIFLPISGYILVIFSIIYLYISK
ncbi:cyd operon protein YbgE [Haemophilus paracuniculus]|uniref:Cyd operon protein YbgE n=1 Tax=Haemophilus paracuniculus TaxID=734 RepID=A0A1T0AQZ2_9PAST|nr:cyd operon protein YbgE [Haemophilus paracuniculus]OOR98702.1 cyd operon protein YbgE [Haemophilus paracuniculus]